MKKIKYYVSMGLQGCRQSGTFDVDDDTSENDIADIAKECAVEHVAWGWEEVDSKEQTK